MLKATSRSVATTARTQGRHALRFSLERRIGLSFQRHKSSITIRNDVPKAQPIKRRDIHISKLDPRTLRVNGARLVGEIHDTSRFGPGEKRGE